MLAKVNIRHLEDKAVHLEGKLSVEELDLGAGDELVHPHQPLHYDVTAQKMGNAILAQGRLDVVVDCECARCLKPLPYRLELAHWVAHIPLEGEEKAPVKDDLVDLTPYIREDILLELPQHPLCEADCAGLPNREAKSTNGPRRTESSTWAELNKLKF